jgi:hypothetical protein
MSSMLLAIAAAASQVAAPGAETTADQALANEKAMVSPAPPPKRTVDCSQASEREIVVCRKQLEDPAKQYVPSDIDSGVPDDDIPHVPPVSLLPPCINAGWAVCAPHVGKMPVHPLIIDVKAIPEPPAGSDADRMAKGEIPPP